MESTRTLHFRKAVESDADNIWQILQQAIARRKKEGSAQWQDGYPNAATVQNDIENKFGHVLTENDSIVAYCAIIYNNEPAYTNIDGQWLTNGDFYVIHRVAVSEQVAGKGYATEVLKKVEILAKENRVFSIKADTSYDNPAMLNIFEKCGYAYCGQVYMRGAPRKAFEKKLK